MNELIRELRARQREAMNTEDPDWAMLNEIVDNAINELAARDAALAAKEAEVEELKNEVDACIESARIWEAAAHKAEAANAELRKDAATSSNYVCDTEVQPREVRFNNGRVVRVVGDGYLEVSHVAHV